MQGKSSYRQYAAVSVALIALIWVVYGQTSHFEFVDYDDDRYILESPTVRDGFSADNLAWAWTHSYFSNWHPLTTMSWMLDVEVHGVDPGGMHVSNVLLHTANVLLLFGLLNAMTGAMWRSAAAAALFAIHPIHAESVAWISSRKDLLFMFFGLMSIWSYVRYVRTRKRGWYAASLLAYACSLLSKQMLVTLPFVLLLLDFWPLHRRTPVATNAGSAQKPVSLKSLVKEKFLYFGVAAVFAVMIFVIQKQHGSVSSLDTLALTTRVKNIPPAYTEYLFNAVWPLNLAALYPFVERSLPAVLLSLAGLTLVSVVAVRQAKTRPYLLCGWCWFLGTLVPVIGIVQVGAQRLADRYSYFPMIGIYIMVVWFIADELAVRRNLKAVPAGLAACGLAILVVFAFMQAAVWQNSVTLYRHALACTDDNIIILGNLALVLDEAGQSGESMECLQQALEIDPRRADTHSQLGRAYHRAGQNELAVKHIARSLELGPDDARIQYNAGVFLQDVRQIEQALTCYRRAVELPAKDDLTVRALNNIGIIHFESGRFEEARTTFEESLTFNADRTQVAEALTNLGILDAASSNFESAARHLRQSIALNPDNAHSHFYLGRVLLTQGNRDEAVSCLDAAVALDPEFEPAAKSLLN